MITEESMLRKSLILLGLSLAVAACERTTTAPPDVMHAGEAASLSQAAGQGLVRTTFPSAEDPGIPFYARIYDDYIAIVDGWAVVSFYRDPGCVPADFNLLAFFDVPAAFGCPHTVEGFSLWHGAPFAGSPKIVQTQGTGAVPYWFIPAEAVLEVIQDGVLTIGELAALPGRLVGHASHFTETLHPDPDPVGGGGHPIDKLIQNAHGTLTDGRRFQYHVASVDSGGQTIRLRIW
jgi:hypothetical protein